MVYIVSLNRELSLNWQGVISDCQLANNELQRRGPIVEIHL